MDLRKLMLQEIQFDAGCIMRSENPSLYMTSFPEKIKTLAGFLCTAHVLTLEEFGEFLDVAEMIRGDILEMVYA